MMVAERTLDRMMLAAGTSVIVIGVVAFISSGDPSFLVVPAMLLIFMALEAKKFKKALMKS